MTATAFDVRGPLPHGTTVLEASAGTGKTFTIAALTARYVAEGHADLNQLLLVTFGRAATAAAVDGGLGLTSVTEWLRRRIDDAPHDVSLERSRRLESDADADAVQILTVHSSKGLEYPVVFLPFGWDRFVGKPDLLRLHDDTGARVLDVGGPTGPQFREACRRHRSEEDGEDLRLMYVALTRAACQVIAWWAPTANTKASALHRFLFGRPTQNTNPQPAYAVPDDPTALLQLRALASADVSIEQLTPTSVEADLAPSVDPPPLLNAARFTRRLDTGWKRTSYSRLTAGQHDSPGVDSETGPEDDEPPCTTTAFGADLPSPMGDLPTGPAFGTLLHALLERCDFAAPDLATDLATHARELLGPSASLGLPGALMPALNTPLGPLAEQRCLADFTRGDRLNELEFELPLHGGDRPRPTADITLEVLGDVLSRHLDADDPLSAYPDRLRSPLLGSQPLRGYLTGSIDAVLRLPGPRYVIVDYKSNWLGPSDGPLTLQHYRPEALAQAMIAAHYPLQALLYATALHRYLRWRQPGYHPATHLGGVLYLFLRGMGGPQTPASGVFGWNPPPALIEELSDLFDGTRR
jgi:exodeoxyribonuclease V beta subunit